METVLACRWGDNRLKTRFGSETLVFSRMKSWVAESMSALIHFVCAAKVDKAMFIYLQPTFTNKKPLTKPQINALEMECADCVRQRLNRLTSHFCLSKSGPELVLKRKVQKSFYAVKQPTNNGPRTSIELKSQKRSSSQGRRRRRNVGKTYHVAGDPHAFGDDAQAQVKNEQHVEDALPRRRGRGRHLFQRQRSRGVGDDAEAHVKNEQHDGSKPESIGMAMDRSEPGVFSAISTKRFRSSGGNRLFQTALQEVKHQ